MAYNMLTDASGFVPGPMQQVAGAPNQAIQPEARRPLAIQAPMDQNQAAGFQAPPPASYQAGHPLLAPSAHLHTPLCLTISSGLAVCSMLPLGVRCICRCHTQAHADGHGAFGCMQDTGGVQAAGDAARPGRGRGGRRYSAMAGSVAAS